MSECPLRRRRSSGCLSVAVPSASVTGIGCVSAALSIASKAASPLPISADASKTTSKRRSPPAGSTSVAGVIRNARLANGGSGRRSSSSIGPLPSLASLSFAASGFSGSGAWSTSHASVAGSGPLLSTRIVFLTGAAPWATGAHESVCGVVMFDRPSVAS